MFGTFRSLELRSTSPLTTPRCGVTSACGGPEPRVAELVGAGACALCGHQGFFVPDIPLERVVTRCVGVRVRSRRSASEVVPGAQAREPVVLPGFVAGDVALAGLHRRLDLPADGRSVRVHTTAARLPHGALQRVAARDLLLGARHLHVGPATGASGWSRHDMRHQCRGELGALELDGPGGTTRAARQAGVHL